MSDDKPRTSRARQLLLLFLAMGVSLMIIWFTSTYQEEIRRFGHAGLIGLFIISIIGNATLIIPAPVFVMACAAGLAFGPLSVGLVAGTGAALGEITGYLAGYGGEAMLPEGRIYQRLHAFMLRHGVLAIFLLAAIPNPIFDVGGIIAGLLKMPLWKFLVAAMIGKTARLGVTAWACQAGIPWLEQLGK